MHPSSCCIIWTCIMCRSALATNHRSPPHPFTFETKGRQTCSGNNGHSLCRCKMKCRTQCKTDTKIIDFLFSSVFLNSKTTKKATYKGFNSLDVAFCFRLRLEDLLAPFYISLFAVFVAKTVQKHSFFLIHLNLNSYSFFYNIEGFDGLQG